ncbi:MAG: hypothetical protein RR929_02295 [Erysipelotrichaceae bacterium]
MITFNENNYYSYYGEDSESSKDMINNWQSALIEMLDDSIDAWDETTFSPRHQIEVSTQSFQALLYIVAYYDQNKPIPTKFKASWSVDKVYTRAVAHPKHDYIKHLLRDVTCFIPADMDFTFDYINPNEDEIEFGSIDELNVTLDWLFELMKTDNDLVKLAKDAYTNLYLFTKDAITNKTLLIIDID